MKKIVSLIPILTLAISAVLPFTTQAQEPFNTVIAPDYYQPATPILEAEEAKAVAENQGWVAKAAETVILFVGDKILWLTGQFLKLAGWGFDASLNFAVVNFDQYANGPGVTETWRALRDISNLFFIFIILYIAIRMILNIGGGEKKLLVNVIVIALLINFSGVIAKEAIRITNLASKQIYSQIIGRDQNNPNKTKGLTDMFMARLDLQEQFANSGGSPAQALAATSGATIMILLAVFVFAVGAILLLKRGIILIALIILSPLAFLSYAAPGLNKYFDQWKDKLFSQSIYAPLYLLCVYFTLYLLGSNTLTVLAENDSGVFAVSIYFAIAIAMMLGSLIIANSLGEKMAGTASNWLSKKSKQAGYGLTGLMGRETIGRLARKAGESEWVKDQMAKHPLAGFALKNTIGSVAKAGFGSKEGYDQKVDRLVKQADEFKDDPVKLAQYIDSIRRLHPQAAEKIYARMSAEQRVKLREGVEKYIKSDVDADRIGMHSTDQISLRKIDKIKKEIDDLSISRNEADIQKMAQKQEELKQEEEIMKERETGALKIDAKNQHLGTVIRRFEVALPEEERINMKRIRDKKVDAKKLGEIIDGLKKELEETSDPTSPAARDIATKIATLEERLDSMRKPAQTSPPAPPTPTT
ncbi:MAG: hypothetical protein AAB468_00820 [Patescibacteria group bacterium]